MIHSPEIPKRHSLVAETATILRNGIRDGRWKHQLPGERLLSEQLCISRPTLRAALGNLEREGFIEVVRGRQRRICAGKRNGRAENPRTVGLIINQPVMQFAQSTLNMVMQMRHHLHQAGFESEILLLDQGQNLKFQHQKKKIEQFLRERIIGCCILILSPEEQQIWFKQNGIPSLVLGSTYTSADLPCLDTDQFAVCRHAAGILLGRGHRHLALVRNDNRVAGDRASMEGFLDGIKKSKISGAKGTVIRYKGDARDLASRMDPLLNSDSERPTGIVTCRPSETLLVVLHLLKRGFTIPGDVSLISRDWDYFFDAMDPAISHYARPMDFFYNRFVRLMLQLLDTGTLQKKNNLILPEFQERASVGTRKH